MPAAEKYRISLPNVLTILRILLTPLLVILLQKRMLSHALVVFAIAGISDGLDGFLARTLNQRTVLGAYLDPLADKLLLTTAFVGMALLGLLPFWLAVVVISRDVLIVTGIAICALWHVHVTIRPSKVSKLTTFLQFGTVFFLLLETRLPFATEVGTGLIWATTAATIVSGIHYLYLGLNLLEAEQRGPRP